MRDAVDDYNDDIDRYNAEVENENQGRSRSRLADSWKGLFLIFVVIVAGGTGSFFLDRWLREIFK